MKHRPVESDQLIIAIEACIPSLTNKLKDMCIRDFKDLYQFRVQIEADLNLNTHEWLFSFVAVIIQNNILLQYFSLILINVWLSNLYDYKSIMIAHTVFCLNERGIQKKKQTSNKKTKCHIWLSICLWSFQTSTFSIHEMNWPYPSKKE